MKLLMYEWKKLWKRKIIWVFTVLLLLLNAGLFLQDYLVEGWINADLYEAKFYYADRFGGDISQNTIQEVQDLMSRLENGEAPPHRDGTVEADVFALREISREIGELLSYEEEMELYADLYEGDNLLFDAYSGRNLFKYEDVTGWKHLFSYQKSVVFILLLLFLAIAPLWSSEKEEDMLVILYTTRKGRKRVLFAKMLCAALTAVVFTALFLVQEMLLELFTFGLKDPALPAYMIPELKMMVPRLTMLGYFLLLAAGKILTMLFASLLVLWLSSLASNTIISMFLAGSGIALFLALGEMGIRDWNPFSLLYLQDSIISQQTVGGVFGVACLWQVQFAVAGTAVILCGAACLWRRRRL